MPGHLDFQLRFDRPGTSRRTDRHPPTRILVMGNFSGDAGQSAGERKILPIDMDSFDAVMARLAPAVSLSQDPPQVLTFRRLEDFHPDRLFAEAPLFARLREYRNDVSDPKAAATIEALRLLQAPASGRPGGLAEAEDTDALLERLLGQAPGKKGGAQAGERPLDSFFRNVMEPHVVPDTQHLKRAEVAVLDGIAQALMRTLLHAPSFQALEALWRATDSLVGRAEADETLAVYLLNLSRSDAQRLAGAEPDGAAGTLHRLLGEYPGDPGEGPPWSLLLGDYSFSAHADDLALLRHFGALARRLEAPFLAAADDTFLAADPEPHWNTLRAAPEAAWMGLACPRLLLRLPYGAKTDPIDAFAFEELAEPIHPREFLWGNAAFACAELWVERCLEPAPRADEPLEIRDLPAFVYKQAGESRLQPCAERHLSEQEVETLARRGIMPFISYRNRNAARLLGFQPLASAPAA